MSWQNDGSKMPLAEGERTMPSSTILGGAIRKHGWLYYSGSGSLTCTNCILGKLLTFINKKITFFLSF